jgi:hypothetical protein
MQVREEFVVKIRCAKCAQHGTAIWEETDAIHRHKGAQRVLKFVSAGFSFSADALTQSGDPEIVCDHCDEVQPD